MAHWAALDENNIVTRVIVTDNNDPAGDEGYSWIMENLGGTWVQTSYNNNFRKQFAGAGFRYDANADVFISIKPYPSWSLDSDHNWVAPVPMPEGNYNWDEATTSWLEVEKV